MIFSVLHSPSGLVGLVTVGTAAKTLNEKNRRKNIAKNFVKFNQKPQKIVEENKLKGDATAFNLMPQPPAVNNKSLTVYFFAFGKKKH